MIMMTMRPRPEDNSTSDFCVCAYVCARVRVRVWSAALEAVSTRSRAAVRSCPPPPTELPERRRVLSILVASYWRRSYTDERCSRLLATACRLLCNRRLHIRPKRASTSNNGHSVVRHWLQQRFDFDSTAIRLLFDCYSTTLRPLDDLHHHRAAALRPK